ncbi:MAG: DUF4838 domain-containing protein [Planctomycetes bacterium]|nr:DUF4838 domain-containing protein [Planctomycetota bacterium]
MMDRWGEACGRRAFLTRCAVAAAVSWAACRRPVWSAEPARPRADAAEGTRGVVLVPEDLSLADWPRRAKDAGLTTIGIHHQNSPRAVIAWMQSDAGRRFSSDCERLGLHVEFELHAMKELLPRELFAKDAGMFRVNDAGERVADFNCCVHSTSALDQIAQNAATIAKVLRPTTGRYFYWGDDGEPWCRCSKCRDLTESEQALTVEHQILAALRTIDPRATLAHLAYHNTLVPPRRVKPVEGIFLEFAPIHRRYDVAYAKQEDGKLADGLAALDANLEVFPTETAQVLEYWLDVSRFSQWKRPGVRLPWNGDVFTDDVATYRKRGIRHITTFAAWIDESYRSRFGDLSFLEAYGRGLGGN